MKKEKNPKGTSVKGDHPLMDFILLMFANTLGSNGASLMMWQTTYIHSHETLPIK